MFQTHAAAGASGRRRGLVARGRGRGGGRAARPRAAAAGDAALAVSRRRTYPLRRARIPILLLHTQYSCTDIIMRQVTVYNLTKKCCGFIYYSLFVV